MSHDKDGVKAEDRVFRIRHEVQSSSAGRHWETRNIKGYDEAERYLNGLYDPYMAEVWEITQK